MQTPDFYWLRQPLISIERLLAVLAQDRLAELLTEASVIEAIRVASPVVSEQLQAGLPTNSKIAEATLKYVLRMSTRCTPFGLFAGGGIGCSSGVSALDFTNRQLIPQHRLDMQVLGDITELLVKRSAIRNRLRYYANRSVYQIGDRLRYTERHGKNEKWYYFTSEVSAEPHILTVMGLARHGSTITGLVQAIATDDKQTEAYQFIERLIDDGLLVSELSLSPTGPDPLTHLINTLDARSVPPSVIADLQRIQTLLFQAKGSVSPTQAVTTVLTEQIGLSLGTGPILQTDTRVVGGHNQLSHTILQQLQRGLSHLHRLSRFNTEVDELKTFQQRFYARFEEQEIPLLLALDDEEGVGYAGAGRPDLPDNELIRDLLGESIEKPAVTFQVNKLYELMLRLYSGWSTQQGVEVEITDQDLAHLGESPVPVPDSYYAFGYFLASSTTDMDAGRFQFMLKTLAGPSAFPLLGRFCSYDEPLNRLVTTHLGLQQAKDPNRIYAEIVHLPQARTGNVVQRPHLRPYEIPYLSQSSLSPDQQLPPDDLLVSVPNGQRVVLRSKRLGKEVAPQLTTAHDYRFGLPMYRFLCDLQHQDTPFLVSWNWGPLAQARRLPRVRYRNIILQEASWSFTLLDLLPMESDAETVERLQQQEQLPRLIALQQGDQELFLDLAVPACRQLFVSTLRRVESMQVVEWLRTPENCPVQGPDGKLTHEVIIPYLNPSASLPILSSVIRATSTASFESQRSFPPGSEWLYMKVYCGPSAARNILDHLVQVALKAVGNGQVTHWFFVRYYDPAPHLRVRFRLIDPSQYAPLLAACRQSLSAFLASGEVHRLQLDMYQRELERYGGETIDLVERIFWRDSELVSQVLSHNLTEPSLLATAVLGIDAYQTAFGLTRQEKLTLCEEIYKDLFTEHGASASLRQTLAQKYRLNQPLVMRLIQQEVTVEEAPLLQAIQRHQTHIQSYVAAIRQTYQDDQIKHWHFISSLSHLYLNRLFSTNQRTYELLIYHHLYRGHQSEAARLTS